ncbi:AarF/UbiB family protein [Endozoicomonas ascidiicola]|uniref:AarF/UbiB family protein n=1 Tax=Endozoicomonas ascidiicola TaxID=1698521 RepID=UPI0012F9A960|nr:AarF/UbiB family protein [Endozoicomonas ascidiicola]
MITTLLRSGGIVDALMIASLALGISSSIVILNQVILSFYNHEALLCFFELLIRTNISSSITTNLNGLMELIMSLPAAHSTTTPATKFLVNHSVTEKKIKREASKAAFSGKEVSVEPIAKKSLWQSIKNIPRNISIFCRAVIKVFVLANYFIKHAVKNQPINSPEQLNSIINNLGPVFAKIMQPELSSTRKIERFVKQDLLKFPYKKDTFTPAEERLIKEMTKAVKAILDDTKTNDMTKDKAQKILNERYKGEYTVGECLGAGTIASCYEITDKNNNKAVAKIMSPNTEFQIAVGTKSLGLFTYFAPKTHKPVINSTLEAFNDECNLNSEHAKLDAYRKAVLSTDTSVKTSYEYGNYNIDTRYPTNKVELTFTVPETIGSTAPDHSDLLIMKRAEGHTLAELNTNPSLFEQEFEKCFGRKPVSKKSSWRDESEILRKKITEQVSKKWNQVMIKHQWIHGDLHSGNIMVALKPGGKIEITLIDLGNSLKIGRNEIGFLKDAIKKVQSFTADKENITSKEMVKFEEDNLSRIMSINITGQHKDSLFKNLHSHEVDKIKAMYDHILSQSTDSNVSEKQKEMIYRLMFVELADARDNRFITAGETVNYLLQAFLTHGISQFKPFLFRIASAMERGGLSLDDKIILTGDMPEDRAA